MAELMNTEEFVRFERKWKFVFTSFAVVFVAALLDHLLRSPHGVEAFWCYSLGLLSVVVCFSAAYKLRDAARSDGVIGGLDLLGEDLSVGDLDD
ncbi:hypothetical protein [Duganella sp. CF458]|uniref:hypothetical protein n=1 Tax=Duganella sp. CF458 TaxID=1884368 RepID=UPI000B85A10F|nr:hypothetical protein [Duganella sp. CF458]